MSVNGKAFPSVAVTREAVAAASAQTGETEKKQPTQPSVGMEFDGRSHGEPSSSGYAAYGSITVGVCAMNKKVF